jgi:methyltransferase (TIGR00027 family)
MPRGVSITAEAVCFHRAIETRRPSHLRLLEDPYAELFLSPPWRAYLASPLSRFELSRRKGWLAFADGGLSGLQSFIAARHRFMDDALLDFLARGGEQVVILGAGYDARALRFADALQGRPFIEVDFPATQEEKRARLSRSLSHVSSGATYLPVDFERQTLYEALSTGPYDPSLRTFFAWEGVPMYLHPETVGLTLETVNAMAPAGSELVCDLWGAPRKGFSGHVRRTAAAMLGLIGEPIRFSITLPEAAPFFDKLGFDMAEMLDSEGLTTRYSLGERTIFPDNCVVRVLSRGA